ncbi:sensor histidine kinase [Nocardioides insulae]|uniref:sensor histidine kinase n=1 Tax=Nocardioides insulae TaxID=394734 RepID=UPI0003F982E4|nr:histidine kinase [Nocardioides insulae]
MDLSTWFSRRWWLLLFLLGVAGATLVSNPGDPVAVGLGIAAGLVVVAVDRWLVALAVNGVLIGVYCVVGGENGPVFFTIVAAVFLAALRTEVRRWLPVLLVSSVAVWAGLLVRGLRFEVSGDGAWQSFGIGALVAAAAAVGTATRLRRGAERDRRGRAAADEKLRMAQELHDGVGHGLAVIAMQAGAALHVLETDPARARESLEAIRQTSRESLAALRAELAAMSGGPIGEPAPRRPEAGIAELPVLLDRVRAAGLPVSVSGSPDLVPEHLGGVVHAVVQESLTNVLRHARARRVRVGFEWQAPATLVVTVADDGPEASAVTRPGMGIAGMRARVESVGGTLSAGPAGEGFQVRAELPVATTDRPEVQDGAV